MPLNKTITKRLSIHAYYQSSYHYRDYGLNLAIVRTGKGKFRYKNFMFSFSAGKIAFWLNFSWQLKN